MGRREEEEVIPGQKEPWPWGGWRRDGGLAARGGGEREGGRVDKGIPVLFYFLTNLFGFLSFICMGI